MIKFGIRDANKRQELKLENCSCPNCFMEDRLHAEVFARYFHIYRVPCFPIQKYALAYCEECGHVIQQKEIPAEAKEQIQTARKAVKFSPKHFIGLILFCCVLVYGLIRRSQINNRDLSYIEQPLPEDIYTIKIKGGYSLLKVVGVKGDTVGFFETEDQEYKYLKVKSLQRRAVYGTDTVFYVKNDLFEKLEEGKIVGIDRE